MSPLSQPSISEVEFERLDQYFSLTSLITDGEAGEVLEKSLNFAIYYLLSTVCLCSLSR